MMVVGNNQEVQTSNSNTAVDACSNLLKLVQGEHLLFQPNTSSQGMKVVTEPHGLVVILICGTLHKNGSIVGVFKQQFGLAKDPLMNSNYRIKYTDLHCSAGGSGGTPSLDQMGSPPQPIQSS